MHTESITLPCGCRITPSSVLGMCMLHYDQWRIKQDASMERWREAIANTMKAVDGARRGPGA